MRKLLLLVLLILTASHSYSQKQEYTGKKAGDLVKGAEYVIVDKDYKFPFYIRFREDNFISPEKIIVWMSGYNKSNAHLGFSLISSESDQLGYTHCRYQQTYNNIPVEFAVYIAHSKNGKVVSVNGDAFTKIIGPETFSISKATALNQATAYIGAEKYKWEIANEEAFIKKETHNPDATYYPAAKQVYFPLVQGDHVILRPAYKFDIYAQKPISRSYVYIDASNGKVLFENKRIHTSNAMGTAHTRYSGTQTITADFYSGTYRLRETGRGNGIQTYNLQMGSDYNSATDFTDNDNNWDVFIPRLDQVATDAHWATEKTYDYFYTKFGRNSIDNNGFALISYVHADLTAFGMPNNINAFWDGTRMTYGDGDSTTFHPLTTVDICGHEITHGLTENTAGLTGQGEAGALNEGFSDIFGTAIEFYAKPSTANWTMGEDCGPFLRNASNPNSTGDPDTYLGTNWDPNEEVHKNSTVLAYWFYLLTMGGTGTNDIGSHYSVAGIGMNEASSIAYRTLTHYLTPDCGYAETRYYSILSAVDLFGACTPQVDAVTSAWYAVGVGNAYIPAVISDFSADRTSYCSAPFTINFQNQSSNASDFYWVFGDGSTSTDMNPSHTYSSYGRFTLVLYAYGGACGSDTTPKTDYIVIDSNLNCVTYMPSFGTGVTQTACAGTLYDTGGPANNYPDNTDVSLTIAPVGASQITIDFVYLDIEPGGTGTSCNYDYIAVYDGPSTASPLIGKYCNTTGPPGTIISSAGAITIRQYSDPGVNKAGFEMTWQCVRPVVPPETRFSASYLTTCSGNIQFIDKSTNLPTSWLWNFGDGYTSTLKNPSHTYSTNGDYTIKLKSANPYGSDSLEKAGYIHVSLLDVPVVKEDTVCPGSSAALMADATGHINWYDSLTGGSLLFQGDTLFTPALQVTTVYYAENDAVVIPRHAGKADNSGTGGNYNNANNEHYMIFDCFRPVVLSSVKVYATGAGIRTILLKNLNEDILGSKKVWIPNGESRVTLNFNLQPANNYRLVCDSVANLFRNGGQGAPQLPYPYLLDSTLSIKGNSANNRAYYYYFYDWEIEDASCVSRRIPVTAVIDGCVGITDMDGHSFSVFPNPAENEFTVSCSISSTTMLHIELLSLNGQSIQNLYNKPADAGMHNLKFDTSELPGGFYLIRISGKDFKTLKKLVVL